MVSDDQAENQNLNHEVYRALKHMGWLLPTTVDEVREAEQQLAENPVEVPYHFMLELGRQVVEESKGRQGE